MLPCKHRPFGFFGIVTNIIFKINHHNRTKLKDIRTKIPVRKKQRTPDLKPTSLSPTLIKISFIDKNYSSLPADPS